MLYSVLLAGSKENCLSCLTALEYDLQSNIRVEDWEKVIQDANFFNMNVCLGLKSLLLNYTTLILMYRPAEPNAWKKLVPCCMQSLGNGTTLCVVVWNVRAAGCTHHVTNKTVFMSLGSCCEVGVTPPEIGCVGMCRCLRKVNRCVCLDPSLGSISLSGLHVRWSVRWSVRCGVRCGVTSCCLNNRM